MKAPKIVLIAATVAAMAIAGCDSGASGGNQRENQQQRQDTQSLENNQPLPHFNYSQERQALIVAETIAANGTQTTSFFFNQGVQDPIFQCQSIGMGVPDSASLSNPEQVVNPSDNNGGTNSVTIGQMDPYGVYVPASSTGTYVDCVNAQGQEYLVRWEGYVETLTGAATWDDATHSEKLVGAPTVQINTKK